MKFITTDKNIKIDVLTYNNNDKVNINKHAEFKTDKNDCKIIVNDKIYNLNIYLPNNDINI